jgi:hypothetical protein
VFDWLRVEVHRKAKLQAPRPDRLGLQHLGQRSEAPPGQEAALSSAGLHALRDEYTRTIEPTRALAAETLTLERTLSDLIQGRYQAVVVEPEGGNYFAVVSPSIHLNPARAGLIRVGEERLARYRWSSYPWCRCMRPSRERWRHECIPDSGTLLQDGAGKEAPAAAGLWSLRRRCGIDTITNRWKVRLCETNHKFKSLTLLDRMSPALPERGGRTGQSTTRRCSPFEMDEDRSSRGVARWDVPMRRRTQSSRSALVGIFVHF